VLSVIDLRPLAEQPDLDYRARMPRARYDVEQAVEHVRPMVEAVAQRGAAALAELSAQWDGVVPASFRVPADALAAAADGLDPALRAAFVESIRRRRLVCEDEGRAASGPTVVAPGAQVTARSIPVQRVGLYVPGGLAPLASSVIMNVVPAQVAGASSIAVTSPPQRETGLPHPNIMALCHLLGVDEVYAVGSAWAIAMFAHGVPDVCPAVDMIVGPGNIYVVAAKRLVRGLVGIDAEAGPTEIAIVADDTADPAFVAADLISQAEHDPLAGSVLITDSERLTEAVQAELTRRAPLTTHAERIATALGGEQSAVVLVADLDQAVEVADAYAAEHLEIHTADAASVAARISNAGAIFVGPWAPVSLGDYSAGSTHVLPTAGCACHSSGLNVNSFLKTVHVIEYTEQALLDVADVVETFAAAENLPAHAAAVTIRRGSQA